MAFRPVHRAGESAGTLRLPLRPGLIVADPIAARDLPLDASRDLGGFQTARGSKPAGRAAK